MIFFLLPHIKITIIHSEYYLPVLDITTKNLMNIYKQVNIQDKTK